MAYRYNPFTNNFDDVGVGGGGSVVLSAGTATSPSLTFIGDSNTGIYSPGADQLAISTGGTGQLFVSSAGNVGIGTSSASYKLHVEGGTVYSSNGFRLGTGYSAIDVATGAPGLYLSGAQGVLNHVFIDSSGRLLMGTSASTLGGNSFRLIVAGTKTYSELIPRDGLAIADNTATAQGVGGSVTFHGIYDGSGNYTAFGGIEGQKENGTSGNYAGALVLKSRTNSGNLNEALRITSLGLVGIGLTPSYQLQLSTDSAGKPSTNTWTIVSDERIKEDIELADLDLCYEAIKTIPLKRYKWRDDVYSEEQVTDRRKLGWIAQDVETVFPKAVSIHEFKYNQVYETVTVPEVLEELDDEGNVIKEAVPKHTQQGKLISEETIPDCKDLNADQIYAAMYGAIQKLIIKFEAFEERLDAAGIK
jgi:hypothetical protein